MGKPKHHRRRHRSRSSSSSSSSSQTRAKKAKKLSEHHGKRSYTPPLRDKDFLKSGLLDNIIDLFKSEQRPRMGMSVRDTDICEFDPSHNDINRWISKIDEHAAIYRWDDVYICHLAINKLRGSAETWYKSLPFVPKTWTEWKTLLAATFPSTRDLHILMTEMLACKPKTGQDLYEYCFEKLSVIRKMDLQLSGSDEVSLIVGGLQNQNIKFSVKAANITDPAKLAVYLKSFDLPSTSDQSRPSSSKMNFPVKFVKSVRDASKTVVCFRCRQSGHKQNGCPLNSVQSSVQNTVQNKINRIHCNYCRKKGHTIEDCFKRKRKMQVQLSSSGNPVETIEKTSFVCISRRRQK